MSPDELLGDPESIDPREGLRTVVALHRLAAQLEALHVARARQAGLSWAHIAAELEVTKQSVHKKYAGRRRGRETADGHVGVGAGSGGPDGDEGRR